MQSFFFSSELVSTQTVTNSHKQPARGLWGVTGGPAWEQEPVHSSLRTGAARAVTRKLAYWKSKTQHSDFHPTVSQQTSATSIRRGKNILLVLWEEDWTKTPQRWGLTIAVLPQVRKMLWESGKWANLMEQSTLPLAESTTHLQS